MKVKKKKFRDNSFFMTPDTSSKSWNFLMGGVNTNFKVPSPHKKIK